jgi:hypothetical protein
MNNHQAAPQRCGFTWAGKLRTHRGQAPNNEHVCHLPTGHEGPHECGVELCEHGTPYDCGAYCEQGTTYDCGAYRDKYKWVPLGTVLVIAAVLYLIWRFT